MAEKNVSGAEGVAKVRELVKDIHIAMLTTVGDDGRLYARPMGTQAAEFDGTLWFLARAESGKIENIREDAHVLVTYEQAKDGVYLSLQGQAAILTDRATIHEHWSETAKAWFPQGEDDPAIAVIKVAVTGGEYWKSSSLGIVRLGKLALGAVLGADKADFGDTGKITL